MNTAKKIDVNFSSLVGLKAELLRKQTEVNKAKLKAETVRPIPRLKKKSKKRSQEKGDENTEKLTDVDDINAHKKSKLMLEAKARLYERLKKSRNNNENFLVDFTNKSDESEEETLNEDTDNETILDNEDDWIEYEDCFGRTRKCLREDLPLMQEKDELIKEKIMNKRESDLKNKDNVEQNTVLEEKEPEIEIMRRKWEDQMQKLADKVNIHYQDILFDEARAHGVGYYGFSQDEEERAKQQENLINLRKETERKQKEMSELKALRERMEQNRLKAARIRQRIRAGLPAELTEDEAVQENKDVSNLDGSEKTCDVQNMDNNSITEVNIENSNSKVDTEENKEICREDKIKALGEALGKQSRWYEMSQEEWIDKRRKDRDTEFAPIYHNFKSTGYLNSHTSSDNKKVLSNKTESNTERNANTDTPLPISSSVQSDFTNEHSIGNCQDILHQTAPVDIPPAYRTCPMQTMTQNVLSNYACNASYCTENKLLAGTQACSQSQILYDAMPDPNMKLQSLDESKETCQPDTICQNTIFSVDTQQNRTVVNRSINEENIAAGLRYLREKFEKSQNH